jgi:photosystem II stability/assembly factor-like uncharacterized protein
VNLIRYWKLARSVAAAGGIRWPSRLLYAAMLGSAVLFPAQAAPVQPGLERPALMVRQPGRVVMQDIASAGSRLVAVGERGVVAWSDDAGQQWHQARVPVSVTLTSVRFANDRFGLAAGHSGVVLATSDRGETWKSVLDGRKSAQVVLEQARASGDEFALKEAERLVADGPDKPLLDILVIDERRARAVGAYGLALSTEDGGATWVSWADRLDNVKAHHIYAIRKRGAMILLVGEEGLLLMSRDDGQTFKRINSPYRGSWFTAELMDDRTLIVAGLRGNAWRSVDGGESWAALPVPPGASITSSTLAPDGRLLLASQAGLVLSVEGDRVVTMNAQAVPALAGLTVHGDQVVTVGVQGARALPKAEKHQ